MSLCNSEELNYEIRLKHYEEGGDRVPTDADVMEYVETVRQLYSVKHILLLTKDMTTGTALEESVVAEKKAQAEDLLAQLRASDDAAALFDQLMHAHSEDVGLESYPDGYLAVELGSMVAPFEEASLALEVGEISDIVESDYGYHIILRLPLEVDPDDYRDAHITRLLGLDQEQWLADYEVKTTQAYDDIGPASFYATLTTLRTAINDEMEARQAEAAASSSAASASGAQG